MAAQTEVKDTAKQIVCKPANMKAPTMGNWNYDRLDELSTRTDEGFRDVKAEFKDVRQEMHDGFAQVDQRFEKVDQRFDKVDQEFKDVRQEMHDGFNRVDERFHSLWGTLVIASFGIIGSIIGTGILT